MKNRRHSEISESEDSDQAPTSKNTGAPMTNNKSSSSSSSDSSSDSEQAPKQSSSFLNRTAPSTSPKKPVSISPIKKFIEQNPDLTQLRINDVLSEDDEVCFLEIPKTIEPEQLLGKVIHFDRRTKIKVNKTRYVIEPNYENVKPFTILTNKLKVVHPVANLQLREYTKRKGDEESVESDKFVPCLPDNLKVRHPLFGAKYENKIVLDEEIQQKLDNTIDQFVKIMKKKKKKKQKERVQKEESEQKESIFTLLESHSMGKKKKKHKEREEVERNEIAHTSFGGEDDKDQSFKKKHKKKKNRGTEDLLLPSFEDPENYQTKISQESPIERDSFKKKHKKKKQTEDDELMGPENYGNKLEINSKIAIPSDHTSQQSPSTSGRDSFKKKHKKKQTEDEEERNASRKKDKRNNLINSTVIPGLQLPSFDFDISSIMNNREERGLERDKTKNCDDSGDEFKLDDISKDKKKNDSPSSSGKQKQVDPFESSGDVSSVRKKKKKKKDRSEDEDSVVSPKKKRKRDKGEAEGMTNSLILDILSRVKNEMDTSVAKHKKKKNSER